MKIPKTFLPGKKLENKVEELKTFDPYKPTALAIALIYTHGGGWATDLMVWTPDMSNPVTVTTRHNHVESLCMYDNLLYEAGYSNMIVDTLHNKIVAKRKYTVTSLCVHDGVMYDGGLDKIYRTDNGKVIAVRKGWVKALCSHDKEMYDAGSYKQVIKTFDDKVVAERKEWIYALCSYNNTIYDAADCKIRNTLNNKAVSKRKDMVFTLFSFNEKLYDAGMYYQIYDTLKFFKKKFLEVEKGERYQYEFYRGITAVQPISPWLAHQLLSKTR
ncbi:MAG: hypothetical protein Q8O03_00345 [Nanoarchaeota archaeon]|nr:hypothetical protein [Nanoarchaeota archaeon]